MGCGTSLHCYIEDLFILFTTFMATGYSSSSATWDGYSQYLNADGLHVVSPVRRLNLFSMLYLNCF